MIARSKLSFSMIEMLVVIGIILLMMGLLLPTVAPMMARAELGKVVGIITGQLEIAFSKSLEKEKIIRVSFEYDPTGKSITASDVLKITGKATLGQEYQDRLDVGFDINGDGVPGGAVNRQYYWMKLYLVKIPFNPSDSVSTLLSSGDALGPIWIHRPLSRVKDPTGKFIDVNMGMKEILDDLGQKWVARPVKNGDLDLFDDDPNKEELLKVNKIGADYVCEKVLNELIGGGTAQIKRDSGMDFSTFLRTDAPENIVCLNLYKASIALYKDKGGPRYKCQLGVAITDALWAAIKARALAQDPPEIIQDSDKANRLSPPDISFFTNFEGDIVDPLSMNYLKNDDEDKLIDEGMSVSIESYAQTEGSGVNLDFGSNNILHNNYFTLIEDPLLKVSNEYYIGNKEGRGVFLRRVWGSKPGKSDIVLLWSYNRILDTFPGISNLPKSTPYFFSVVFDRKNGSGMYFCNSFGSTQMEKLYFQVSDDDNRLTTMIRFTNGGYKEGSFKDLGLVEAQFPDYFIGMK